MLQTTLDFPPTVKLDFSKLIIGGHSYGGVTAIAVAWRDKRVKACAVLDPWMYVYH